MTGLGQASWCKQPAAHFFLCVLDKLEVSCLGVRANPETAQYESSRNTLAVIFSPEQHTNFTLSANNLGLDCHCHKQLVLLHGSHLSRASCIIHTVSSTHQLDDVWMIHCHVSILRETAPLLRTPLGYADSNVYTASYSEEERFGMYL